MALTTVSTANRVKQWDSDFFREYVRMNRFKRYMGVGSNNVIVVKKDLTKKKGDAITIPLVTKLTGAGVTGNSLLEGNEEAIDNYGHQISVTTRRNAVAITGEEEQASPFTMRDAAKPLLKDWCMEKTRDDVITALGSIDGTAYGSASEGAKDTWVAANSDRVLFGDALGNGGKTDHSADLATVTAAMTLDAAGLRLLSDIAKTASPAIRPIRTAEDEEYYVVFCDSRSMRDLRADTEIKQAQREAWTRGKDNPLFKGGDIVYGNVIVREVPEIASLGGVGNASAVLSPVYLCGAQAVGAAWAKLPKSKTEVRDYGFVNGVAIEENLGIEKLVYNSKQHGVVTGYFAAAANA